MDMKNRLAFRMLPVLLVVTMLAGGTPSGSQDRDTHARVPEPFIGAWRLVSLEVADERAQTFTYYVEGALVRTLVGKALRRVYEFKGNQLIVKSANPAERWRAVWEHY